MPYTCSTGPCWSPRFFPTMPEPLYILSTDDFLVISGRDDDGVIVIEYSSDLGTTWTSDFVGYVGGQPAAYVTYGNGIFLGLAGFVQRVIGIPSGTTINWTVTPVPPAPVFISNTVGLLFDGTYFVAYGPPQPITSDPALLYSSDGQNWSVGGTAVGGSAPIAIAHVDGIYVLSFGNGVWYTNNLTSPMSYASSEILDFIAAGNGRFVAVARDGNIYISTDGAIWTNTGPSPTGVNGITFNQDRFIISNVFSDSLAISPDGITWTLTISPHLLPSSNTVPGNPEWIGYDVVSGNSQGDYIALFRPRVGLGIPQAVATIGVCPCSTPTTGDYWARFVNVRMRGISVSRIGAAPPPPVENYYWTATDGYTFNATLYDDGHYLTYTPFPSDVGSSVFVRSKTIITEKCYCEFEVTAAETNSYVAFGVTEQTVDVFYNTGSGSIFVGSGGCGLQSQGIYNNGSLVSADGKYSFAIGDRIGIALDATTKNMWISKNGVWLDGDPSTLTAPSMTVAVAGDLYFYNAHYTCLQPGLKTCYIYPGASQQTYSVPTGFSPYQS